MDSTSYEERNTRHTLARLAGCVLRAADVQVLDAHPVAEPGLGLMLEIPVLDDLLMVANEGVALAILLPARVLQGID